MSKKKSLAEEYIEHVGKIVSGPIKNLMEALMELQEEEDEQDEDKEVEEDE